MIVYVFVFLFISCSDSQDQNTLVLNQSAAKQSVPALDRSRHSVPLEHILFDTFQRTGPRTLPLTEAGEVQILRLRDAIPPLHNPPYQTAKEALWLKDNDLIVGYTDQNDAWAFPVRILNFHEIVNDTFHGIPVLVSYCPLCRSGIVYHRQVKDRVLQFGNTSALYESAMVMLDYETGSYWWQTGGKAIAGTLTGKQLDILPSTTVVWSEWKKMHPGTKVLSWYTGYLRSYESGHFVNLQPSLNMQNFSFPVSLQAMDSRLPLGSETLVVRLDGKVKAYPIAELGNTVVQDEVDGVKIVVFVLADQKTATAFYLEPDDHKLSFRYEDGMFVDESTNSRWNLSGIAVEGTLKGKSLRQVPSKYMFWFAAASTEPDIEVYRHPR